MRDNTATSTHPDMRGVSWGHSAQTTRGKSALHIYIYIDPSMYKQSAQYRSVERRYMYNNQTRTPI